MPAADGPTALLAKVRAGDQLALARGITAIENGTVTGVELALSLGEQATACRTIGVTGAPGAGKSSLINALISELLPIYPRIGVLTVDPSSPVSGGAVLGDRVRMAGHSANPAIFIRSLAARGHLGGVTRTTRSVIGLLASAGIDLVIVETVGTGQSEVEVAAITHLKLVVCAPGLGDEMQAIKAGILEIADFLVVNKADLPDAARTAAHLRMMLHHRGDDEHRSLLQTSSNTGAGIGELAHAVLQRLTAIDTATTRPNTGGDPRTTLAQDTAQLVVALVRETPDPRIEAISKHLAAGTRSRHEAAVEALQVASTVAEAGG